MGSSLSAIVCPLNFGVSAVQWMFLCVLCCLSCGIQVSLVNDCLSDLALPPDGPLSQHCLLSNSSKYKTRLCLARERERDRERTKREALTHFLDVVVPVDAVVFFPKKSQKMECLLFPFLFWNFSLNCQLKFLNSSVLLLLSFLFVKKYSHVLCHFQTIKVSLISQEDERFTRPVPWVDPTLPI
jgi:hypothetical protein